MPIQEAARRRAALVADGGVAEQGGLDMRELLRAMQAVRAGSGAEALKKLMADDFAVILLDVSMPGIDGFETASLIHEHPRFERTPIIFVSGVNVSELDRLKGYKAGAVDYVNIPLVPEILRGKLPSDPQLSWTREVIERQLGSLTRLVDDLLDVSHITLGKINVSREPLELGKIVARAIETAQPLLTEKCQQLEADLPDAAVKVHGDLTRLTQIVGNILANAAKYTDEGRRAQRRPGVRERVRGPLAA